MKIRLKRILFIAIGIALPVLSARGQSQLEDAIKQLSSENVRGYLQPFIDGFGANLNSGLMRPAHITTMGLGLKFEVVGVGTLINSSEKSYTATPPEPFDQTPVQTATIFGDRGTVVTGPGGLEYQFQNGQFKAQVIPVAIPQVFVGNLFGTQAVVRYAAIPKIDDFPDVNLFGIGARHSISQYIPESPVDLAAGVFYQNLSIGDIVDAKTFNISAQISKSFSVLSLYGGVQYETSNMNVHYVYTGSGPLQNTAINLDFNGENDIRGTAGLGLNLVILHINTDISIGKVKAVSAGIGFGL
jgi:hypothetical protein